MRRTKHGGFFVCLVFALLMNPEGLIPSAVLLILHFWLKLSVWWAVGAAAAWLLYLILWTVFIGWVGRCASEKETPKENKNPYSVGNTAESENK